jgi:putative transcriptional regulator
MRKIMKTLDALKDLDIEVEAAAIEADAGMPLPGLRESLADAKAGRFGRVHTPEQILLREARRKTGRSQTEFARLIATPVATLRDWEQGRFSPPGGVTCLMRLLSKHPKLVEEL